MAVDADLRQISIIRAQLDPSNESFIQGLFEAGEDIVDLASQLAPKDTEELSKSGDVQIQDNKVFVSFGNGLEDDRAIAQEYGTIFMPAQPYLLPAARAIDILFHVRKRMGL